MSGFSSHWLSLREPIDHQSRNAQLQQKLVQHFATYQRLTIVDLGAGTGSNLRALAPFLSDQQNWRLIDYDRDLLQLARNLICEWADDIIQNETHLLIEKAGKQISISFESHDLAQGAASIIHSSCDVVTAAAFFDLVSASWIEAFCRDLAHYRLPLFTVLSYDGEEHWTPPHSADRDMLQAFHKHQASDKGFGAAAGPRAVEIMRSCFQALGYEVDTGASPWQITSNNQDLMIALAEGSAQAVRETGLVEAERIAAWLSQHRAAQQCVIGHQDLFARLK